LIFCQEGTYLNRVMDISQTTSMFSRAAHDDGIAEMTE
jgi:hypothetical protein